MSSDLLNSTKKTTGAKKSGQIFTHVAMHVSTNFRSLHKPSVIQVTEGTNGLMSVNNLNWKNQFRWVSSRKPVIIVSDLIASFLVLWKLVSASLYHHWTALLQFNALLIWSTYQVFRYLFTRFKYSSFKNLLRWRRVGTFEFCDRRHRKCQAEKVKWISNFFSKSLKWFVTVVS